MTIAIDHTSAPVRIATSPRATRIAMAGAASLGAGAIHAAAIGVHAEHRPAALAFTAVAALQLAWGAVAIARTSKPVVISGLLVCVSAFAGWVMAKSSGISFIDGLNVAESIQVVDGIAAGLAMTGAVLLGLSFRASTDHYPVDAPRFVLPVAAVLVTALSVYGMAGAGTHVHAHGESELATGAAASGGAASDGHEHAHGAAPAAGAAATADPTAGESEHAHEATAAAKPYDPTKPIDLSGTEGVTPEQQAAAENLIAVTLVRLPKWSDPDVALAAGFHSIGDGLTGVEHFVNEEFMRDESMLDPDRPESLVYDTTKGGRILVAAMFMTKPGVLLEDVPNVGGALMQWHIHDNLCYQASGVLGGITDANGNCPAGLIKPENTPMVHVWITAHKCGPFAALEGIGGGTIADGEERLCDHEHGNPASNPGSRSAGRRPR